MNNIDLELYKVFKIVADNNNITRAAEILYISQPAVTKQINNLESLLNKKLFDRTKNGTFLTEDGKKLYERVSGPIDKLLNATDIFEYDNKIDLGVHINMPKYVYNDSILEYYKNDNNSIINIHLLTAEQMINDLEKEKIDLAFSKEYDALINDDSLSFIKLGDFNDVLVVRSDSKYMGKSIDELKQEEVYTLKKFSRTYENLVRELDFPENNIQNVNFTGIMDLLNSRDIITYLPKEYIKEQLDNNTLTIINNTNNKEPYGIYYNVNKSSKIDKLIDIFKNNLS